LKSGKFRKRFKIKIEKAKDRGFKITLDLDDRFFRASLLDAHEINYLICNKYKVTYQQDIFGKFDYFLVQPDKNESVDHFFMVYHIKETLEEMGIEVKVYNTKKPDVIFRVKNKFIAIEVETGSVLKNNKKQFLEKVETLNDDFGGDWFFVVTNRNLLGKYKKYGKTSTRKQVLKSLGRYVDFCLD